MVSDKSRYDIALLRRVRAEILDEMEQLERLKSEIEQVPPLKKSDNFIHIRGVALCLHDFYNGVEKIFRSIAKELNGGIPKGDNWHNDLLYQMGLSIENLRPPVISRELDKTLREYLGFRHVVRHVYGYDLDYEKINPLLRKFPGVFKEFSEHIHRFTEFIERMIEEKE